ncbi:MAG: hypothetical protein J5720_03270 [Bacteroidaceae bacterium]|nr:hypothetical protein [Bacteroidaceae bacterium]
MRTITRNNPIATVIKNYTNKKSGKVTESRKEIQRRFMGLDWKDQKKIMAAFLDSGASDRDWAYSRLLDLWDDSFRPKVQELWETYHEMRCTWVVIRHFPLDFLKERIDQFTEGRDYYFICRRMDEDATFVIDKERLSRTDYLMALAHRQGSIEEDEATDVLFEIVREVCFCRWPYMELSRNRRIRRDELMSPSDFKTISIALYYLEELCQMNVVRAFREWECWVRDSVRTSDEFRSLNNQALTDFEYTDEMAGILQKHLYYTLPERYKTMTDAEYNNKDVVEKDEALSVPYNPEDIEISDVPF